MHFFIAFLHRTQNGHVLGAFPAKKLKREEKFTYIKNLQILGHFRHCEKKNSKKFSTVPPGKRRKFSGKIFLRGHHTTIGSVLFFQKKRGDLTRNSSVYYLRVLQFRRKKWVECYFPVEWFLEGYDFSWGDAERRLEARGLFCTRNPGNGFRSYYGGFT